MKQSAYQAAWAAKRRSEWVEANGPCTDCGCGEDLQVDHVDASKKVSHRVWSWSKERREAELAKCIVQCQPCHAKKTTACGEHARGQANGQAILTEDAVREIRVSKLPRKDLAEKFNVDPETIKSVRARRSWKYVV